MHIHTNFHYEIKYEKEVMHSTHQTQLLEAIYSHFSMRHYNDLGFEKGEIVRSTLISRRRG